MTPPDVLKSCVRRLDARGIHRRDSERRTNATVEVGRLGHEESCRSGWERDPAVRRERRKEFFTHGAVSRRDACES